MRWSARLYLAILIGYVGNGQNDYMADSSLYLLLATTTKARWPLAKRRPTDSENLRLILDASLGASLGAKILQTVRKLEHVSGRFGSPIFRRL